MDIIRVMRLVEYIGPRDLVEEQVAKSLHGSKTLHEHLHPGYDANNRKCSALVIRATTLGVFPEVVIGWMANKQEESDVMNLVKKEFGDAQVGSEARGVDHPRNG